MKHNRLSEDGKEFLDPLTAPYDLLTDAWMNAWMQPLETWQRFVGGQWQRWLDGMAQLPSPWLPALAAGREGQPPAIDFFLPWLPIVEDKVRAAKPEGEAVQPAAPKEVQPAKTPAPARAPRKPAAAKKAEAVPARKPVSAKRPAAATKAPAAPAPKPAAGEAPADKPAPARRRTAAGKASAPAKPAPRTKKEV